MGCLCHVKQAFHRILEVQRYVTELRMCDPVLKGIYRKRGGHLDAGVLNLDRRTAVKYSSKLVP